MYVPTPNPASNQYNATIHPNVSSVLRVGVVQCGAVRCSVLQCVAVCCYVLQCITISPN